MLRVYVADILRTWAQQNPSIGKNLKVTNLCRATLVGLQIKTTGKPGRELAGGKS